MNCDKDNAKRDVAGWGGCQCPKHAEVVYDSDLPSQAEQNQIAGYVKEILLGTTERSTKDVITRAVGIYRSIVRHVRTGGTVQFVAADGSQKALRVRVRRSR